MFLIRSGTPGNAAAAGRRSGAMRAVSALIAVVTALVWAAFATPQASAAASTGASTLTPTPASTTQRACAAPAKPGFAQCMSLIRTDVAPRARAQAVPDGLPSSFGYGPASLQSAYDLPSSWAGAGQTVAVVDAFDDPDAAGDLAYYRTVWGLPQCNGTTGAGCVAKVNQNGAASPLPAAAGSTGWASETSLDLDMVSAACPNCRILLVETNSSSIPDLGSGVNTAVALGAKYVSNSYGGPEYSSELKDDASYYNHPGVVITVSAGDDGYGVSFPAASPHVTAVGGTSLTQAPATSRGWQESIWSGTGSGCSAYEPKPAWQDDIGCAGRTDNDVSAIADPNTPVSVFDSYDEGGWILAGGTSAATPFIAATYALAGTPDAGSYPSSYPYAHTVSLNDVTLGNNSSRCAPAYFCQAAVGYDAPSGWGTPHSTGAFGASANVPGVNSLLGVIDRSGNALVKQGGLSAPWVTQYGGVAQMAVASDPVNGPLIAVLTGGGEVFAKEGASGAWIEEFSGAVQVAVASDPARGPLLAVLTAGGEVFALQGSLSAVWVDEYSNVTRVSVATDFRGGPLIAVLTSGGSVLVKQGSLSAGWVDEYDGATQVSVASDSVHGPLIAVLTTGGSALAKEGGLSTGWTDEYDGASQVAVSSDPVVGPLIAVLTRGDEALAKQGGLSTNWVDESEGVLQVAVGSDPVSGPLISLLLGTGDSIAKSGSLTAPWVAQYSGVIQVVAAD